MLGGVRELIFNRQGWGDPEASQLAVVLPLCRQLSRLELRTSVCSLGRFERNVVPMSPVNQFRETAKVFNLLCHGG